MSVKFMTRTAILLALTIVFQTIGRSLPFGQANQFVTGSLVNACLIIAAASVGIWGGLAVSVLSPFGAILTGAPINIAFAPFIAVGNFILVLLFFIFRKKQILGVASGAVLKFGFLFASINLFVNWVNLPEKQATTMLASFSWPQLVTAIIGGALALAVLKTIGKSLVKEA